MKKYFMIIIGIIAFQNIYGLSNKEVLKELESSAWEFEKNFDSAALEKWNKAFDNAKRFILDKSKNFFGTADKDISHAMYILEEYVHDKIVFLATRNVILNEYVMKEFAVELKSVKNNMDIVLKEVANSSKKESKNIITVLVLYLTKMTQNLERRLNRANSGYAQ